MKPGRVFAFGPQNDGVAARLFDFDAGKHELKAEHSDWLRRNVAAFLKRGGSLSLIGLASRTDASAFNMVLSRLRANAVLGFLRGESPNDFRVAIDVALGEQAAQLAGGHDGVEDENWRAVVVSAWLQPAPPPRPVPQPTPRPPLVERLALVKVLISAGVEAIDDAKLAGLAQDVAQRRWGGSPSVETKAQVPSNYRLVEVVTSIDTAGTVNLGFSSTDVKVLVVEYHWGSRKSPCLLVDGYGLQGAFKTGNPAVHRLTEAQADLWVSDPKKALQNSRDWNLPRLSYDDYKAGKLD